MQTLAGRTGAAKVSGATAEKAALANRPSLAAISGPSYSGGLDLVRARIAGGPNPAAAHIQEHSGREALNERAAGRITTV